MAAPPFSYDRGFPELKECVRNGPASRSWVARSIFSTTTSPRLHLTPCTTVHIQSRWLRNKVESMFKEERDEALFDWGMIGNIAQGRPNMGSTMDVTV